MLLLSIFGLILLLPTNWKVQLNPADLLELVLCAFLLGVLTLLGYLLNNFGIRKIGGSRAAIIGATIPALTVIFAGFIIQETLQLEQALGVLLVTFGAVGFCFEKIRNQTKPYNKSSN
jgi:drug/metabolite transporter (DMT)-like permease